MQKEQIEQSKREIESCIATLHAINQLLSEEDPNPKLLNLVNLKHLISSYVNLIRDHLALQQIRNEIIEAIDDVHMHIPFATRELKEILEDIKFSARKIK